MAGENKLRSTIVYAFAATTPAPPRDTPQSRQESAPDIEVEERLSMTPIGDGPNEVSRTFASIPPPPAALLPEEGDIVGGLYELIRKLGEGTFGRVYVARRVDVPEHQVALKIMPRSLYVGRNVERELVMLATVGHPHVVQLKDHGTTEEYVWLTMPVYEGETLFDRLQRGPLSLREAYDIFRPIAYGLEALHDAGLRHQDIKPDNIYLAVFGRRIHPVLLDLGVAAEKDATFVAGTALYASPEQIFALDASPNKPPLTEKMDTYSLGTTLLISLVGPEHFPGESATQPAELAVAHATRATNPLAKAALPDLRGEARRALGDMFMKWLALEPKDRPSMREMAEQLDVLLEKEREEKRLENLAKERQKTALLRFRIAVGALLLIAAAAAIYVFNKRETLRLANELEQAKSEGAASFDKLDTCVASHKVAKAEALACKAQRDKAQAEFEQAIDDISKKSVGNDKLRDLQVMVGTFSGKLKACEDASTAAQQKCTEDTARILAMAEKEKNELAAARDEQKALAEAREKEIAALKAERDSCNTDRTACNDAKNQCIDQKAQILIACSGATAKPATGPAPTTPSTATAPSTATTSATGNTAPAPTPTQAPTPTPTPAPTPQPNPTPAPAPT
ncbi:MAG: protein kinase [Polyangiaceae bacterium]|nr:protein kinase [Polyangiaceae bacterium]